MGRCLLLDHACWHDTTRTILVRRSIEGRRRRRPRTPFKDERSGAYHKKPMVYVMRSRSRNLRSDAEGESLVLVGSYRGCRAGALRATVLTGYRTWPTGGNHSSTARDFVGAAGARQGANAGHKAAISPRPISPNLDLVLVLVSPPTSANQPEHAISSRGEQLRHSGWVYVGISGARGRHWSPEGPAR